MGDGTLGVRRAALILMLAAPILAQAQRLDTVAAAPWAAHHVFSDARAVQPDPAGRLFVADAAGSVVVLDANGMVLQILGGSDRAPLREPEDLDPTNGLVLLIADPGAGRIYRFGADGLVLESLGGSEGPRLSGFDGTPSGDAFMPIAVASNSRNDVFALDGATGRLLRWDLSRQRTTLSEPDDGVLVEPRSLAAVEDRLYVLDRRGVVVFDTFGTAGRRFAALHAPEARRIRLVGDRLALVLPQAVALYNLEGGLEQILPWEGPPLRDVALTADALFLLAAHALYRVER